MNLNKVIIVGRLTRDPELRALPSGKSVVSLSIANNSFWTDANGNKKEATEYHNVIVFGKLADTCSQYLSKGQLILVEGRIQTRSWNDQGGNKRYKTEIIASNMQMGPRPGGSQAAPNKTANPASQNQPSQPAPVSQEDIPVINAEEPMHEEIPSPDAGTMNAPEMEIKNEVDVKSIPF